MLITMAFVDNFLSKKHNLGHFFLLVHVFSLSLRAQNKIY